MKKSELDKNGIAREIIEGGAAVAVRVSKTGETFKTEYVTNNIDQYGYRSEDFTEGRLEWMDIIHPDDRLFVCDTITKSMEEAKQSISLIFRILSANGETVWVSDMASGVFDEQSGTYYCDNMLVDYTAIKQNLETIEDNAKQQTVLNDILKKFHDLDVDESLRIMMDQAGKYLNISRVLLFEDSQDATTAKLIYEWKNEGIRSLLDGTDFVVDYKKDIPEVEQGLLQEGFSIIDFGAVPEGSLSEFKREGILASAIFAVYRKKKRLGFICFDECVQERVWETSTVNFLRNISKLVSAAVIRKENLEALRISEKTMEMILNNVPNYIYVVDVKTHQIVFMNEAFKKDFPKEAIDSREQQEFLRDILSSLPIDNDTAETMDRSKPHYFEVHFKSKDCWLGVQYSLIRWTDGRLMRLFTSQDISEKKQHDEHIRYIAYMDHLTGLPNRHRCDVDLQKAKNEVSESGKLGFILFIDMDDFKIINDGYGHDYGDGLLIAFADFLREEIAGGRIYRFGGDEFVILLMLDQEEDVYKVIDRILERSRRSWRTLDKTFYCTVSIGVSRFPDGKMRVSELMKNADIAMHEAKKEGKNKFMFYSRTWQNDSMQRAEMEVMMRDAIDRNFEGFEVYYQPYQDTKKEHAAGAEALLRWFSPNGLVMPGDFIPLSEYLGLIVPLGEYVLREAAKTLKHINDTMQKDFMISVNVSIRQLQQQDIVTRIDEILLETEVNPDNLVLEITEGMAAIEFQRILMICEELRKKGIHIAMDDFGTGYSSLGNMRKMPIDIIKIDRSFVRDITFDAYSDSFIRLITNLGHSMGKNICIEGVETEEQLHYCKEAKVDTVQGFYFYKPVAKEEMLSILKKNP